MGVHRLAVVLSWLALGATEARALEAVLLPDKPLVADGQRLYVLRLFLVEGEALVPGVPEARAEHGAVVGTPLPAQGGGVSLRYRPPKVSAPGADTLAISIGGKSTSARVALEPAGRTRLAIEVSPDPLLVGKGAEARVIVRASDAAGRPARAPLRLGASVGRLSPLRESAPGQYEATYSAPEDKFPQVAILAAGSIGERDAGFAAAPLRLSARVTLPGEGEPGGSMTVNVDGKSFGPQPIGPDGRFAIPVIVPPGGKAIGTSTDALGNKSTRSLDLALPPFPRQVLAVVPPELPADGRSRAEVLAYAVDARGRPERGRAPSLSASRGTLSAPVARGDGAWSFTLTVPGSLGDGLVSLKAGSASATLRLRPAPPFHLELVPPREPLTAGGEDGEVEVKLADQTGSPVSGAKLEGTFGGGRFLGASERAPGRYAVRLQPPRDPGRTESPLHLEISALQAGAPRRVTLHAARASEGQLAFEAWVDDDLGIPVANAPVTIAAGGEKREQKTDRFGTARIEVPRPSGNRVHVQAEARDLPGLSATLDVLLLGSARYAVASTAGRGAVELDDSPPGASLDSVLPLQPQTPVDLRITVEPPTLRPGEGARVRVVRTARDGRKQPGRILPRIDTGQLDLLAQPGPDGKAELRLVAPRDAKPGQRLLISITDAPTGVTAVAEVPIK